MPIHIKGAGGAQKTPVISVDEAGLITATAGKKSASLQMVFSSLGYTESYDEKDADYITLNPDAETITIKPENAAERYGLSRITGVDNLCIRIRELTDPYHEIMLIWGVNVAGRRWLYIRWEGNNTISQASDYHIDRGSFDSSYDETTGILTISGCDVLSNLTEGEFSLDARVTWEIE